MTTTSEKKGRRMSPEGSSSSRRKSKTPRRTPIAKRTPPPRRRKPGANALREIRHFQRTTTLLLRRLPFARLVSCFSCVKRTIHHVFWLRFENYNSTTRECRTAGKQLPY